MITSLKDELFSNKPYPLLLPSFGISLTFESYLVVAALESDKDREPFNRINELFALSENVQRLEAVCTKTGLPAPFSILKGIEMIPISKYALSIITIISEIDTIFSIKDIRVNILWDIKKQICFLDIKILTLIFFIMRLEEKYKS